MVDQGQIFDIDQFVLYFQQYFHYNTVFINEGIKIKTSVKKIRLRFDTQNRQIFFNIENFDFFGWRDRK